MAIPSQPFRTLQSVVSSVSANSAYFINSVGIGTDAPDQKLHVLKASAGPVTADTNSIAVFEGGGNSHLTILTPDGQTGGVVFGSPTDNFGSYLTWNYDNNALKLGTDKTGGFISLLTDDEAEAIRITSTGKVGIGTIVPAEKLTVSGNVSATGAIYSSGGNSNQWNAAYTTTNTFSSSWTDFASTLSINTNTVILELSAFSYFLINLNSNISSMTFRNPKVAPQITSFVLQLSADGTARSVAWPASIRWPGGTAPTITSTANKVDTFAFFSYDSGISYYGFATGTNS
jgi:hypothetical protein